MARWSQFCRRGFTDWSISGFGTLELFIVPVGPNEPEPGAAPSAMRYESVFG